MSYSVSGTTITLTRGDTFVALISITKQDGTCVSVLMDAEGIQLARQTKTFSDDGSVIETEVVYGSQTT